MIEIRFDDLAGLRNGLTKAEKKIKFGLSLGINRSVQKVKLYEQAEMLYKFKSPKPFTVNSIFTKMSSIKQAIPHAIVGLKDNTTKTTKTPAALYLAPQIEGGVRRLKPYETKLTVQGRKRKFSPTKNMKLNAYGNVRKAKLIEIAKTVDQRGGTKYFSQKYHGRMVIFEKQRFRGKSRVRAIMAETKGSYSKIFNFFEVGKKALEQNFNAEMHKAMFIAFNK